MPPLVLLQSACCAAAAAAAPASAIFFSRPAPSRSSLRASNIVFSFPRLKKYGRRDREPVTISFDDDDDDDDDDDEEEEVDEDVFLKNRPKPAGFGAGKTYTTDIEERLLREMGLGSAAGRRSEPAPSPANNVLKAAETSAEETPADLSNDGVHVRISNLPKKKNIHKDLNLAFKGFPGLSTINPAISATKKTRDPICKGFAFLKLESLEAATRFIELYSRKTVSFGKVEKPIKCCIVDRPSPPSNQASSSSAISQPGSNPKKLAAVS